jgi:DNA-binding NtrC family response regulator
MARAKQQKKAPSAAAGEPVVAATPVVTDPALASIGYVVDNMEGAVDQAVFLASVDIPIAVIGARGTGKMYIAKVVHQAAGGTTEGFRVVDCREFRSREQAFRKICALIDRCDGDTLVLKSPQLMHPDTQNRLARMISSRTFAFERPPRYLPKLRLIGLFPDSLDRLLGRGELSETFASAFAGYPIRVPPLRERGSAVLRWAEKILGQEAADQGRVVKGFTPEAERAMLAHDWRGNITEVRERVISALNFNKRQWLTPADLGLRAPLQETPAGSSLLENFLEVLDAGDAQAEIYTPSPLEELDAVVATLVQSEEAQAGGWPLGTWLQDELVLAAMERYADEQPRAAEFLQIPSRNIGRWLPRIEERAAARSACDMWREAARLVRDWVRALPATAESPIESLEKRLLTHLERLDDELSTRMKSTLLGVSAPTYQKRVRYYAEQASPDNEEMELQP